MITLFYSPGACSLASHIVLNELDIPFDLKKVDLKTHRVNDKDFYDINPRGSVPTLRLDDNTIVTQNLAILVYLADLKPENHLLSQPNGLNRTRALEWLAFLTSDVHKAFAPLFKPQAFVTEPDAQESLKKNAIANIEKQFRLIENMLPEKGYALGENFSVVDTYLFVFYRWSTHFQIDFNNFPKYQKLIQNLLTRESVVKALEVEGLRKG